MNLVKDDIKALYRKYLGAVLYSNAKGEEKYEEANNCGPRTSCGGRIKKGIRVCGRNMARGKKGRGITGFQLTSVFHCLCGANSEWAP